jgi:hypothetical protein
VYRLDQLAKELDAANRSFYCNVTDSCGLEQVTIDVDVITLAAGGSSILIRAATREVGAVAARGTAGLAQRAGQIHGALDPIAQAQRTTAVLQTNAGRVVAGGVRDLTPAQRALLSSDEVAARLPGAHAEVTALDAAARMGATPQSMAVIRAICPQCAVTIEASGGTLTSPTTVIWK